MSNLLERAIIDAKALKEAALKNAEQLVIEKYSLEVKEAMGKLLEQDDADALADLFGDTTTDTMDTPAEEVPSEDPTAEEGEGEDTINADDLEAQLPDAFLSDDDEIIQIKLDSLEDEIEDDEVEGPFATGDEISDDEIGIDIQDDEEIEAASDFDQTADITTEPTADIGLDITPSGLEEMIADALKDVLSEDEDLSEEIDLDELMERVRVEGIPQKSGWAGTPESIMKEYESMLLAREQDSEVKEENEELRKNVAALQNENKTLSSAALKLQNRNTEYKTAFDTLQEKLETMNVSNAKLLYINQALENASLNERQKRKIVEAISKAGTVQEAKIVFETMNDTVVTTSDVKKETTLSEMVSRKSSLLVAARKEQPKQGANPLFNRMQTLAGIKTN
jgi:hypothetical protein